MRRRSRFVHPKLKRSTALTIGKLSIIQIFAIFVAISVASAALFAAIMSVVSNRGMTFEAAFRACLSTIWNPADLLQESGESVGFYVCAGTASLLGIALPIFFLGAFVYKLFDLHPVEWRSTISFEADPEGQPVMAVRFYNSSPSVLVNNTITLVAKVRSAGSPAVISEFRLSTARRNGAVTPVATWLYGRPGVPFTVYVPLPGGLSAEQIATSDYFCLPGRSEAVDKKRVHIVVLATGTILDNGNPYVSAKEYPVTGMQFGHHQEIETDYDAPPRTWRGWHNFEGLSPLFIFGYGSLAKPDSVEKSLEYPIDPSAFRFAMLSGWRRLWNVGSDKASHPERTLRLDDGQEFSGVNISLGIEPAPGADCCGAVFPINRPDLSSLDKRERNYERIEVTDDVTWAGKPKNCIVYTYVPLPETTERIAEAERQKRTLAVRAGYIRLVEAAFALYGQKELYRESTPKPPFPVLEMEFVEHPPSRP